MMNSQSHFRALSAAIVALALLSRPASAQTADSARETAREQYRKALDAADRNDWAEARRLYLELWNKSRSYDVASGLGLAEFHLGRHALGARLMARALDDMPLKEKAAVRQELESMLTEMKKSVAVVHLTVNQDSAEIRADGELLGTWPSVKDLYLEPGTRTLEAVLGSARASRSVTVTAGQSYTVVLTLVSADSSKLLAAPGTQPLAVDRGLAEPSEPKRPDQPSSSIQPKTLVIIGGSVVTAAFLTLGVVEKLRAGSAQSDADRYKSDVSALVGHGCSSSSTESSCSNLGAALKRRDSANSVATVSFVTAGIAAAATASVLLFWKSKAPAPTQAQARLSFSLSPGWSTVSVAGSF